MFAAHFFHGSHRRYQPIGFNPVLSVIVRDIGPELGPLVKPERVIAVETALIFDWAVWADGEGAVEGARTECIGYGF